MKIRPSLEGGASRRHVLALLDSTALTAVGPALVGAALALGLTAATARADEWKGTVSDDWFIGGNWVDGSAPAVADDITIDTTAPNSATIDATPGAAGDINVGLFETGALTIRNGGSLDDGRAAIGYVAGSNGTVTVTDAGSSWTNSAPVWVGYGGTGTLIVSGGADVTDDAGVIAIESGSTGTATITGGGSTWTNAGNLTVGDYGRGTLTVEAGGAVSNVGGFIGAYEDSIGKVTVTGAGSAWTNSGSLTVGNFGAGMLTIEDGGAVSNSWGYIGGAAGSTGVVTVTGHNSTWTNSNTLFVGDDGQGILRVEDEGEVDSAFGVIGAYSAGAATVTGAGSNWTITGELLVGSLGEGTLTVEDGGSVNNVDGHIGFDAGSTGTVTVTGGGSAWTNTGDLFVGSLGAGTLTIGTGATVSAGGLVSVADQAGSTGLLVVNGTLTGTGGIEVNAGGRLGGAGTVTGNTTVAGTVAPGNSIGTLHVTGPYTQAAGSTYEVEIDAAGNSDLIDVAGTATLNGGTVEVIPFPDFALATPYTILTATGGRTGTFAGATMGVSSAFLSPQLTYGANDVTFTITRTASFASAALTSNEEAAATGADSLGTGNAIWDAIVTLGPNDAPAAFDAISGEVHASAKSVLIEDSRFLRQAIDARLRAAFAGVGAKPVPVLAYGDDGPEIAPADTGRFAAWGQAFGSWGEWDGDGNAAALTRDTGGFVLGGDMTVADSWRLGMLAGYSSSSYDIADRASSGSADSYHLGAYAGTEIGKWGLRFGGAYSWHDIDTARTASFPGFTDHLSADYDAATAQLFGETGYRIDTAHASFEPFANLAYVNVHTDGFTETGGAAALTAASSSQGTTFTTLGLRAGTALPLGGMTARLHGMLGWRHAFGDVSPTSDLAFAGGGAFKIAGVPIAEDAAVIEAGLEIGMGPNANLDIAYNGQIGDGARDQGVKARFGMTF